MLSRLASRYCATALLLPLLIAFPAVAQTPTSTTGNQTAEGAITSRIRSLRQLDDKTRATETRDLAKAIRALPSGKTRLSLAAGLANLSTEGDFGKDTLYEVGKTLAEAIQSEVATTDTNQLSGPINTLAQLVRYENVPVKLDTPSFRAALSALDATDKKRAAANFTLTDLHGKAWTLKDLKGKVVVVNFWATWCPPCRKELPDLENFYTHYGSDNLVVLGITDETADKVEPFLTKIKLSYPILLDPKRTVNDQFAVQGIPHTFIYDRNGKLVAQAIDMRTAKQFQELLAKAGLK